MMGLTWLGSGPAHAALEGEEREVADESGSVESFSGSVVSLVRSGSGSVLFRMDGRIDVRLAGMVWREELQCRTLVSTDDEFRGSSRSKHALLLSVLSRVCCGE
jgi:hypothetical protein